MDSATAVVNAWSNEVPPNDVQRQTLLNCDFKDIGVGYFFLANDTGTENHQQYWTVLLAK